MKAAVAVRYGGPEVLEIRDVPMPEVASDGVLVRVRAIGLNFADIFGRIGVYPGIPKPPFIPGLEFSGDVVAVGRLPPSIMLVSESWDFPGLGVTRSLFR